LALGSRRRKQSSRAGIRERRFSARCRSPEPDAGDAFELVAASGYLLGPLPRARVQLPRIRIRVSVGPGRHLVVRGGHRASSRRPRELLHHRDRNHDRAGPPPRHQPSREVKRRAGVGRRRSGECEGQMSDTEQRSSTAAGMVRHVPRTIRRPQRACAAPPSARGGRYHTRRCSGHTSRQLYLAHDLAGALGSLHDEHSSDTRCLRLTVGAVSSKRRPRARTDGMGQRQIVAVIPTPGGMDDAKRRDRVCLYAIMIHLAALPAADAQLSASHQTASEARPPACGMICERWTPMWSRLRPRSSAYDC